MIKHAHLKWHRELIGCIINVRGWSTACIKGPKGHSGGEDERGHIAGECDYARGYGGRFGRHGCDVLTKGLAVRVTETLALLLPMVV